LSELGLAPQGRLPLAHMLNHHDRLCRQANRMAAKQASGLRDSDAPAPGCQCRARSKVQTRQLERMRDRRIDELARAKGWLRDSCFDRSNGQSCPPRNRMSWATPR